MRKFFAVIIMCLPVLAIAYYAPPPINETTIDNNNTATSGTNSFVSLINKKNTAAKAAFKNVTYKKMLDQPDSFFASEGTDATNSPQTKFKLGAK